MDDRKKFLLFLMIFGTANVVLPSIFPDKTSALIHGAGIGFLSVVTTGYKLKYISKAVVDDEVIRSVERGNVNAIMYYIDSRVFEALSQYLGVILGKYFAQPYSKKRILRFMKSDRTLSGYFLVGFILGIIVGIMVVLKYSSISLTKQDITNLVKNIPRGLSTSISTILKDPSLQQLVKLILLLTLAGLAIGMFKILIELIKQLVTRKGSVSKIKQAFDFKQKVEVSNKFFMLCMPLDTQIFVADILPHVRR